MRSPSGTPDVSWSAAVSLGPRATVVLALASIASVAAFCWPLLWSPAPGAGHAIDAPIVLVLMLPVLVGVVMAELGDGGIDAKALAMLAVLSAVGAALRPLGAGTAGIELVFFLLVLAGRVFGPGFGFVLGGTTMFASALLTGGVGPWLPFQMMAAGWVGLGAGVLPSVRGRAEIALLAAYGAVAAFVYGTAMNLWFWPFGLGAATEVSYVAGAPVGENLRRFLAFNLVTSMGWDLGRAITNVVLIVVTGPAVLAALRRAHRRAAFDAPVVFAAPDVPPA